MITRTSGKNFTPFFRNISWGCVTLVLSTFIFKMSATTLKCDEEISNLCAYELGKVSKLKG